MSLTGGLHVPRGTSLRLRQPGGGLPHLNSIAVPARGRAAGGPGASFSNIQMRLCPVFISILTVIALAVECRAGRPLVIDDAAPVDLHKVQVEAGIGMYKDSARWHVDVPLTLAYGLAPGLEVGVASGAQFEWRESPAEDEAGGSRGDMGAEG